MTPKEKNYDDFDLLEFFELLWSEKIIIIFSVIFAGILSIAYQSYQIVNYESVIAVNIKTLPPNYKSDEVLKNYVSHFNSEKKFNKWKKNNNSVINFNDFENTYIKDVSKFVSPDIEEIKLAKIVQKDNRNLIFISSNESNILDDFYRYAEYVDEIMTEEYLIPVKEQHTILDALKKEGQLSHEFINQKIIQIRLFFLKIDQGNSIFEITYPSIPIPSSTRFTLPVFLVLGFIIGVLAVLYRNASKNK